MFGRGRPSPKLPSWGALTNRPPGGHGDSPRGGASGAPPGGTSCTPRVHVVHPPGASGAPVSVSYPSSNPQGSTRAREGLKKPSAPRWEYDPGVEVPLSVRRARLAHLKRALSSPVPVEPPRDTWIEPEKWSSEARPRAGSR